METLTLYKKVGRRYIKHDDYFDERGLPIGLYLFYKENYKGEHSAMMNMIHYAKVHDIKNIGKFSDIYSNFGEKIQTEIHKSISDFRDKKDAPTISDLANIVCKVLSEL